MTSRAYKKTKIKSLPFSFFRRTAPVVARELLGQIVLHRTPAGPVSGIIVETEAYGAGDPASHAFCGLTPRNSVMFGPPGKSYVYFTYGMHYCFNVVTEPPGRASAVLIRAVEPLRGFKIMQKNRKIKNIFNLTSGPAKFARAFGFDRQHNNLSVRGPEIFIVANRPQSFKIVRTTRIGIKKEDRPRRWRFYIKDNPFVSKK